MITTAANTTPRYSYKEQRKWVRGWSAWKISSFVQINCLKFKCPINKAWRYLQTLYILYTKAVHKLVLLTQHEGSWLFISLCGSTPRCVKLTHWISPAYGKSFWAECLEEVNLLWAKQAAQPASEVKQTFFTYIIIVGLLLHDTLYAISQKT